MDKLLGVISILYIENLEKSYGQTKVLTRLNISINKGEIVGIIGNNGSGKSTLLKIILGLVQKDKGDIYLFDKEYNFSKSTKDIGFLIESPLLLEQLTGYDNLIYHFQLKKIDINYLGEMINQFNLNSFINEKVSTYSLGMRQILGVATAFVSESPFVILDEPINTLDPKNSSIIKKHMEEFVSQGGSILLTSHILSDIQELCDRIYFLRNGELQEIDETFFETDTIEIKVSDEKKSAHILQENKFIILKIT